MNDDQSMIFDNAADLWEKLKLPLFKIEGYLDGRFADFTVPEVLRVAALRLRALEVKEKDEKR